MLSPRARVRIAAGIFIASLIGWPLTAFTIFSNEPQGVLGLSWLAITLTAADIMATTDVRDKTEANGSAAR